MTVSVPTSCLGTSSSISTALEHRFFAALYLDMHPDVVTKGQNVCSTYKFSNEYILDKMQKLVISLMWLL